MNPNRPTPPGQQTVAWRQALAQAWRSRSPRERRLLALGLAVVPPTALVIDGEPYVALEAIDGLQADLDERTLALRLTAKAPLLGRRVLDARAPRHRAPRVDSPGGFLNWALAHSAQRSAPDGPATRETRAFLEAVRPEQVFLIAQDLTEIEIHANIDEADVGRLREGQVVTFSVNAYPNRTFQGRMKLVRLGATTVQNVVTYTGVVSVSNADRALLPGMTANIQIVTDSRESALRALQAVGFTITSIRDVTPIPHNGVRPSKRRRV